MFRSLLSRKPAPPVEDAPAPTTGFHVTVQAYRDSIASQGLRMTAPDGSSEAERQGNQVAVYVFSCEQTARRYWYREDRFDVWKVDLTGLPMERDPRLPRAWRVAQQLPAERLALVA